MPWFWQTEKFQKDGAILTLEFCHDANPIWWRRMSVRERFIIDLHRELQRLGWKRLDGKHNTPLGKERHCRIRIKNVGSGFNLTPEYEIVKWYPVEHRRALGFETLIIEKSARASDLERDLQQNECSH